MGKIAPQVKKIMGIMKENGYESYAVGGAVRDLLRGGEPCDWDMTTNARPEQIMALFEGHAIPTGLQHGTVTVRLDGISVEMTTYRVDGAYEDHRHPDCVEFTDELTEDLKRRDFTVNAMAMDEEGNVTDVFGGQADLAAKRIRCVGDPKQRFEEDALRILRAIRFSSTLGFPLEQETDAAVHAEAPMLQTVAAERLREELLRLLCGRDVLRVLLEYSDVLGVFLPEILPSVGLDQRNRHHCYTVWEHIAHTVSYVPPEGLLRMTMLIHDLGKPASMTVDEEGIGHFRGHAEISCQLGEEMLERLKFDNESQERILKLVKWHDVPIEPTEKAMRRALNKMGAENVQALLKVKRADNLAQAPEFLNRQLEVADLEMLLYHILKQDACFSLKQLAVNGHDLLELGYRGKEIGTTLQLLLEAVIDERLPNNKKALLASLEKA